MRWIFAAVLALQVVPALGQTDTQLRADSLHKRGLRLFEVGAYSEALKAWNLAIAQETRAPFFHYRGLCYYYQGNVDQALTSVKTAVSIDPSYFPGHRSLAELYWLKIDFDRCLEAVTAALKLEPNDPEARFIRGRLYVAWQNYTAAVEDYAVYIAARPTDADGFYMRGKAHRGLELYARAEADYRAALQIRPDWADAWNDLALVQLAADQPVGALSSIERAVGLAPAFAAAHINHGVILQELGRTADACAAWRTADRLHDPDAQVYLRRYCR